LALIAAERFSSAKTPLSFPAVGDGKVAGAAIEGAGSRGLSTTGGVEPTHAASKVAVNGAAINGKGFRFGLRSDMAGLFLRRLQKFGLQPVNFGLYGGDRADQGLGALPIVCVDCGRGARLAGLFGELRSELRRLLGRLACVASVKGSMVARDETKAASERRKTKAG
jgi:hypothetical protein